MEIQHWISFFVQIHDIKILSVGKPLLLLGQQAAEQASAHPVHPEICEGTAESYQIYALQVSCRWWLFDYIFDNESINVQEVYTSGPSLADSWQSLTTYSAGSLNAKNKQQTCFIKSTKIRLLWRLYVAAVYLVQDGDPRVENVDSGRQIKDNRAHKRGQTASG